MVLDLSAVEANSDSPEVAALKAKVTEVAKKYTDKHGWCGEVRRALAECGITPEQEQKVVVTTALGLTFTVPVRLSRLVGLDEEEQRAVFADLLSTTALAGIGGTTVTGRLALTPEGITDLSLASQGSGPRAFERDGMWVQIAAESRVTHFIPHLRHDGGRWMSSDHERAGRLYATCGQSGYVQPGGRHDLRHCRNCERLLTV